jgi:GNAT superfamily N-acetyltransferase
MELTQPPAITVRAFTSADQDAAKALILGGLEEHWGTLDLSLNPDLDDIGQSYGRGLFLVACCGERIVGTGALLLCAPDDGRSAQIVRMSVAADMRRCGIGRRILGELCDLARARGVRRLVLETTSGWHEVIAFYRTFGFHITHREGGDTYFELEL